MSKILNCDTGEYYKDGYGSKNGPMWTKSKWTCLDMSVPSHVIVIYEVLKKAGFNVVIEY